MTKTLKKWLICLFAALALVLMCAAWLPATSFAQAQTDSAPVKNLYDVEQADLTFTSNGNYFAKHDQVTLGSDTYGNAGTYYNAVHVCVGDNGQGQFISELVYDISAYDYDFFTAIVGTNNYEAAGGYTNELIYQVYADGDLLTQTSHALKVFELERLACKVPADAQTLTLRAVSAVNAPYYGDSYWVSPALSYFTKNGTAALKDMPVSGNNTEIGQEEYAVKSATLNDGQGGTIVDKNAITGAIHGNYAAASGGQLWKFGADYDISGANYTRLTMDVGMLFNETENNVVFTIRAIGGVSADLAVSPAMNGTTYHHFDVAIPVGTTKIQIYAQSQSNMREFGNLAICNATLYKGSMETPVLYGEVTCTESELAFGDPLPALQGEFRVNGATVPGTLALDADQTLQPGTNEYTWTFTAAAADCYQTATGSISLEVGPGNGYISPSNDEAEFVLERDDSEVVFPLLAVPETIEIKLGEEGSVVAKENYHLDADGSTLSFAAAYLESLGAGDHVFHATCENGDFTVTIHVRTIQQVQPELLNLYNEQYTTITSQYYPPEAGTEYFAKLPSIDLGRGENAQTYVNVLQVLVNGPFTDQDPALGTYFSALTYDISDYRYDYFSVTVGNARADADGNGNFILYQVMVDGQVLAQTTHYLAPYETQLLTCKIPAGAQEIRLHAQSENGLAYGECNWANPVLTCFEAEEASQTALSSMTPSGLEADEHYAVGSATLNNGEGGTITDENAITGNLNGPYGEIWKFGADFDISDKKYNRLTMDVGVLNGDTQSKIVFIIRAIEGASGDLAVSPAIDGSGSYHFDIVIPAGTTKIQIWAQSENNVESRAAVAFCNATLYAGGKQTPTLLGSVTSAADDLQWGDGAPALSGNFTVGKATVQGTLALDAGQTIEIGTHTYSWTFTPADTAAFATVTGTVELTAGRRTLDLSGVAVEDASFVYDGTAHSLTVSGTLPEFVSVRFDGNSRTAVGTTEVIVSFVIDEEHADLYEPIPSRTAQLTVTEAAFIGAEDAAAQHTLGSGQDVSFTLSLDAVNATVSLGGSTLSADDVTVNGRTVTFSANYLETLGEGEHVFTVSTDGGTFTLTVTCEAARGCGGVLTGGGIAFTLLAAGAAVAIVLVRRRRTDGK